MRISFSLAVLASMACTTPITSGAALAQSAGALMQVDAHDLESVGSSLDSHGPDYLVQAQADQGFLFRDKDHTRALKAALDEVFNAYYPHSLKNEEYTSIDRENARKALAKALAPIEDQFYFTKVETDQSEEERINRIYERYVQLPVGNKKGVKKPKEEEEPLHKLYAIVHEIIRAQDKLQKWQIKTDIHGNKFEPNAERERQALEAPESKKIFTVLKHIFTPPGAITILENGIHDYNNIKKKKDFADLAPSSGYPYLLREHLIIYTDPVKDDDDSSDVDSEESVVSDDDDDEYSDD